MQATTWELAIATIVISDPRDHAIPFFYYQVCQREAAITIVIAGSDAW
jgi:hypothetical protein